MIKRIKFLVAVALLGGLFFGGLKVLAIDTDNMNYMMTISPPQQRIVLMPGEVYEGSINVSNMASATKDLKYSVHIGSFNLGKDENGEVDYNSTDVETVTSYNQMMDWIKLGKESGTVAPDEIDTVPFTITVPEDAPAGGQYATIIFQDNTNDEEADGNVAIENVVEFAAEILAEVAGETRDDGVIIENNIPGFILNNKLSAMSTVKNDGNVHTDASYVLQVWPMFSDEEICTNEEKPTTSIIMPGTERKHAEECNLPAIGIYKVKQTVKIFGEVSEAERMVIFCPLWLLFLILFAIIALILWFVMRMKSRKE